jgi:nucleoside-diphosphate-sugar epimerase
MASDNDQMTAAGQRALVMGASGNVGACVTRHLVSAGADVRLLLRKSSSTKGIEGLDVERHYGGLSDTADVAAAMSERDVVYIRGVGALSHRDFPIGSQSARLIALTSPASHAKATRELGWYPTPTEHFIQRAAQTYVDRGGLAAAER